MTNMQIMKKNIILDVTKELVLKDGIDSVTIEFLSKTLGIGEATIYRYFKKKENIIIEVATRLWTEMEEKYFNGYGNYSNLSGYDKIKSFFNIFLDIYIGNQDFIRFITSFDNYILSKGITYDKTNDLSFKFKEIFEIFNKFYNDGIKDNTLKTIDIEGYYYCSCHSLLNLCIKLSKDNILHEDSIRSHENEIKLLIEILMYYIKN